VTATIEAEPEALVEAPADVELFLAFAMERGWGDGLPLIPPTYERVERMLEANSSYDPDFELGVLPPRKGRATVRQVAINAVMAGCLPEYLPIILTAIRGMLEPKWNLPAIQSTTHPVAPLVVIHGPIAAELGANWSYGCFGPGNRVNATIGRAIRLVLMNIGGARPGNGDQSVAGQPSKYTYCIAENVADSPWPALHVRRGLDQDESSISVIGCTNPENVNDHVSGEPVGILHTIAGTIATPGTNNTYMNMCEVGVIFGPEHAQIVASHKWTVDDVTHYLYEHARMSLKTLKVGGMWGMHDWARWNEVETDDSTMIPIVRDPSDFIVFVAGAKGKHSVVVKAYGENLSVTLPIWQG
jgi:hypothetical protein